MRVDVGREDLQRAAYELHCPVGVPARTPAVDLAQPAFQPRQRPGRPDPGQARQVVGDGGQPVDARSALPGALARQIVGDPRRLHEPARVWTETTMTPTPAAAPMARSESDA